jgi:NADH dehydrogenase
MAHRLVCVFGGSGFIGRHLVRRLAHAGDRVRIAVRDPEGAHFLKPLGNVGQIVAVAANLGHEGSIKAAAAGADAVVNLVGTFATGKFEAIHVDGPDAIAAAARAAGAKSLVHVSALGADAESPSAYGRSKAAGEAAVRAAFPGAVILRPSLVFGPEDDFYNRFATLSGISPILPAVGTAQYQPVYVGDVADAIMAALDNPAHAGKTFSLGGPRRYTMREIMAMVLAATGRKRLILSEPLWQARLQSIFLQFVPGPLKLTPDQVRMLAVDNVVPEGAPGLAELGITPTAAEVIVPTYLARFRNPFAPRQPKAAR